MPRKIEYTSVSISKPFMEQIQEYVKNHKNFISAGDFIRTAIREKMEK